MVRLMNLSNADIDSDYNLEDYDARDASGDKMGSVDSVIVDSDTMQPRYLVIDSGGWFSSDKYVVPMGEVDHVDDTEQDVYFRSLTKDQLKSGSYPEYDESWWDNNDGQAFGNYEQHVANSYTPRTTNMPSGTTASADTSAMAGTTAADRAMSDQRGIDYNGDLYNRPMQNAGRLQLLEEHLVANRERYQAGTVRLGKRVIERQESISVPVTEERVVIDRQPVTDGSAVNQTIGQDQTIEVPIQRERVNVQKETVPTEEVGLRKETTQRNERVQGTVRKEELDVQDQQGLLNADGSPAADREGMVPDPALRNRADMANPANVREGRFPNDEQVAAGTTTGRMQPGMTDADESRFRNDASRTAGSLADRARNAGTATEDAAAEERAGMTNEGRSAIDSARSDTPGAP